jgi:hypothetical protein
MQTASTSSSSSWAVGGPIDPADLQATIHADVDDAVAFALDAAEHIEPSATLLADFVLEATANG